jgi:hypothetical protein
MIVFDGTYRLQPDTDRGPTPKTKWLCTWRVRIIELPAGRPAVRHLKPTVVVANPCGLAASLNSCAEAVGKKISRDFKLDIKKVLWIEHIPARPGQWHAAIFTPKAMLDADINYRINWRPLRPDEQRLIKRFGISTP